MKTSVQIDVDAHLTHLFTRDVIFAGGSVLRRLRSTEPTCMIEYWLMELEAAILDLREVAGHVN